MASKTSPKPKKQKAPTATDIERLRKAQDRFSKLYQEFKAKYDVSPSYISGILKNNTKENT